MRMPFALAISAQGDGQSIRSGPPIGGVKDAQVLGEASRQERQNRLGEPAQPRDDPLSGTSIDNGLVHAENHDGRPACAFRARIEAAPARRLPSHALPLSRERSAARRAKRH